MPSVTFSLPMNQIRSPISVVRARSIVPLKTVEAGSKVHAHMRATDHPLLERLGTRIRALRSERALTRRQLAENSGLSERFMAELESGRANISVVNLAQLAAALGVGAASLIE